MRPCTLVAALLAAFLTFASPAPASAQFDFGAVFQRAQMIANQATLIADQVGELRAMARHFTELENQLDHMERAARGRIDALTQPFRDLAAEPVGLVRDGLAWSSDFTGTADEVADAVRDFGRGGSFTRLWRAALGSADRVGEADILDLYRSLPPKAATRAAQDFRRSREAADRWRTPRSHVTAPRSPPWRPAPPTPSTRSSRSCSASTSHRRRRTARPPIST